MYPICLREVNSVFWIQGKATKSLIKIEIFILQRKIDTISVGARSH